MPEYELGTALKIEHLKQQEVVTAEELLATVEWYASSGYRIDGPDVLDLIYTTELEAEQLEALRDSALRGLLNPLDSNEAMQYVMIARYANEQAHSKSTDLSSS